MPLNPKILAKMIENQLPLAKEQSCGCGGCTCGRDEVEPELTKSDSTKKEA